MTQSNLVDLAKQGDPQAIATLMNRSLQPKGITATVERERDRLKIYLIGTQPPNRDSLMVFVQNGINNLELEDIGAVEVIGQQTGELDALWTQEWQIDPAEAETGFEFPANASAASSAPPAARPAPPPAPPLRPPGIPNAAPAVEDSLNRLNEAIDAAVRDGFSELEYRPLAAAPQAAPASTPARPDPDNLPPELLAADAARQVRDELPPSLLADADMDDLLAGAAPGEGGGAAPFPSINELAVEGTLNRLDEIAPTEIPGDIDFPGNLSGGSDAIDDPSVDDPSVAGSIDPSDDLTDWMATIPPAITPSPDMDSHDDIQITSLSDGDFADEDFADEDFSRNDLSDEDDNLLLQPLEELDLLEELEDIPTGFGRDAESDDLGLDLLDDLDDLEGEPTPSVPAYADFEDSDDEASEDQPYGQMVGSPMAIQPLDQEDDLASPKPKDSGFGLGGKVIVLFLAGWILALIGWSLWTALQEPEPLPAPTSPSPQAERPRSA